MLKHPRLTIERIHQYVERFRPLFYAETVPLSVEVAGPVDRIPYADAQSLDYKPAQLGMQLGP
ncbi:MAG TPA: hypothetical protein VGN26_10790, partial [Armatimonadota bacterium]